MDSFRFGLHFLPSAIIKNHCKTKRLFKIFHIVGLHKGNSHFLTATHSISMLAFFGNETTSIVLLAGKRWPK